MARATGLRDGLEVNTSSEEDRAFILRADLFETAPNFRPNDTPAPKVHPVDRPRGTHHEGGRPRRANVVQLRHGFVAAGDTEKYRGRPPSSAPGAAAGRNDRGGVVAGLAPYTIARRPKNRTVDQPGPRLDIRGVRQLRDSTRGGKKDLGVGGAGPLGLQPRNPVAEHGRGRGS